MFWVVADVSRRFDLHALFFLITTQLRSNSAKTILLTYAVQWVLILDPGKKHAQTGTGTHT